MAIVCVILRVYFSFVNESACGSLWKTVLWFFKERWARSWRPRLRQLPQALSLFDDRRPATRRACGIIVIMT